MALMRVITSAPKPLLLVEHRLHRQRRTGRQVEQRRDHSCRPEVERDGESAPCRVAWLEVDQYVVYDHSGHFVVVFAQHRAGRAQQVQVGPRLEVIECLEEALEICRLVGKARLCQFEVPLLYGRAQDDAAPDTDSRRLRARHERRHLDAQVARHLHPAREAPASRAALLG